MGTQETVYYQQGNTTITNARAMIGGTTYALANITSVGLGDKSPSLVGPLLLLLLGGCTSAVAVGTANGSTPYWIMAAIFVGLGILVFLTNKTTYFVRIATAAGEQRALESKDKAEVEKIVGALNEAIVKRG